MNGVYRGEELYIAFSANMELCDYGVPGSPVWWEPVDIQAESVEILGIPVPIDSLPDDLQNAIQEISEEVEWESTYDTK